MKLSFNNFENLTHVGRIGCVEKDGALGTLHCAACTRRACDAAGWGGKGLLSCVWDDDAQEWLCPTCGSWIDWVLGCLVEDPNPTLRLQYARAAKGEAAAETMRRGFISQWALNLRWEAEQEMIRRAPSQAVPR